MSSGPVFIVGMPRSGTTVLQAQLSAHTDIAIPPETHFVCTWMQQYSHLDLNRDEDFDMFWSRYTAHDQFTRLEISPRRVLDRLGQKQERLWRTLFESILEEFAAVNGKSRIGEKTPGHFDCVDTLLDWFPDCRVLWLVRDPRAVCASYMHVPWTLNSVVGPAWRWRSSMLKLEARRSDQRILPVVYEEFVANSQGCLQNICRFLGAPYHKAGSSRPEISTLAKQVQGWKKEHFLRAADTVRSDSIGKWSRELTEKQIGVIEKICEREMLRHGYQMTENTHRTFFLPVFYWNHLIYFSKIAVLRPGELLHYCRHLIPIKRDDAKRM